MAYSQWPTIAGKLDDIAMVDLAQAYMRRKKWEADVQAATLIKGLAVALGNDTGRGHRRIDADDLLSQMGVTLQ